MFCCESVIVLVCFFLVDILVIFFFVVDSLIFFFCIKCVNNMGDFIVVMLVIIFCCKDGISVVCENCGGISDDELFVIVRVIFCVNDEIFCVDWESVFVLLIFWVFWIFIIRDVFLLLLVLRLFLFVLINWFIEFWFLNVICVIFCVFFGSFGFESIIDVVECVFFEDIVFGFFFNGGFVNVIVIKVCGFVEIRLLFEFLLFLLDILGLLVLIKDVKEWMLLEDMFDKIGCFRSFGVSVGILFCFFFIVVDLVVCVLFKGEGVLLCIGILGIIWMVVDGVGKIKENVFCW